MGMALQFSWEESHSMWSLCHPAPLCTQEARRPAPDRTRLASVFDEVSLPSGKAPGRALREVPW